MKLVNPWLVRAVVGVVGVAALLLFHFKQRDSYCCQVCWSRKDVFQWRCGIWMGPSAPLTPKWNRVTETHFLQDLLPTDHTHDWVFAQGSPYHFFGTMWGGCAIGRGRHVNSFCQFYESSEELRAFVGDKLRDGSLSQSDLVAMLSRPSTDESSQTKREADALVEMFFRQ